MNRNDQSLKILQYNLRKSRILTTELFENEEIRGYNIIAIQEPGRRGDGRGIVHSDKAFLLVNPPADNLSVYYYIHSRLALTS